MYAEISEGQIGQVIHGDKPSYGEWLPIIKKWSYPTDYPTNFYAPTNNLPRYVKVGEQVHEKLEFELRDLQEIKDELYLSQKATRQKMQLGAFLFGDVSITLKDREDSLIISSLQETTTKFKVSTGVWIELTPTQILELKTAHSAHVQAAYTWEMEANERVTSAQSHTDLKAIA